MPKHDSDFVSHLEELRHRLIFSFAVFLLAAFVSYFFSKPILDFLIQPLREYDPALQLYFQKPYEAFLTHLKVSALSGVILASPVLLAQAWFFMAPGLYTHEKNALGPIVVISTFLFLVGAFFAYAVVIPWGLNFLLSYQTESLKPILGVSAYFSFMIGMILAFGILFDFPVVLIGLVRLGVTSTKALSKLRKMIVLVIFITAAILTPSPDPISQLILAIPLLLLFELSLIIARVLERKA